MKKFIILSISLLLAASCSFEKPAETEETKEPLDFSLVKTITISSTLDGSRVMIFDSNPLVNGKIEIEPILTATSPFSYDIKLAKIVNTLYVYSDGEIQEYPSDNITISNTGIRTKGSGVPFTPSEETMSENSYNPYYRQFVNSRMWSYILVFEDTFPYSGDYDFNDVVVLVTERSEEYEYGNVYSRDVVGFRFQILSLGASHVNSITTYRNVNEVVSPEYTIPELTGFKNVFEKHQTWEELPSYFYYASLGKSSSYWEYIKFSNGEGSYYNTSYNDGNSRFPYMFQIPLTSDFTRFYWTLEGVRIDEAYPRYKEWVDSGCSTNGDWYTDTPVAGKTWNKELPDGLNFAPELFGNIIEY